MSASIMTIRDIINAKSLETNRWHNASIIRRISEWLEDSWIDDY